MEGQSIASSIARESRTSALDVIRQKAEEVCSREGCSLYDIELVGSSNGRVLRLYIDKDGDAGVSIDDCSHVSRGLNEFLDANEDIISGEYHLEVSSPGVERPLREARHFQLAIGKKILVRTFAPLAQFNEGLADALGKAKQVQGTLLSQDERGLKVRMDSATEPEVFVPMESVTKAHIVFEFADPSEQKAQKKGKAKK